MFIYIYIYIYICLLIYIYIHIFFVVHEYKQMAPESGSAESPEGEGPPRHGGGAQDGRASRSVAVMIPPAKEAEDNLRCVVLHASNLHRGSWRIIALLWYTLLYDTTLYYAILYATVRYNTILYYTMSCYTIPYYTIPYHTILDYTVLYSDVGALSDISRNGSLMQRRARLKMYGTPPPHTCLVVWI